METADRLMAERPYYRVKFSGSKARIRRFGSGFPVLKGRSVGLEPLTIRFYNSTALSMFITSIVLFILMLTSGMLDWIGFVGAVLCAAGCAAIMEYIMRPLIVAALERDFGLLYKPAKVNHIIDIRIFLTALGGFAVAAILFILSSNLSGQIIAGFLTLLIAAMLIVYRFGIYDFAVINDIGIGAGRRGKAGWNEVTAVELNRKRVRKRESDIILIETGDKTFILSNNAYNVSIIKYFYRGRIKNIELYR